MIFQHTWQKVLSGEKFQTRRIVKPRTIPLPFDAHPSGNTDGDWLYDCYGTQPLTVFSAKPCKPGTGFWGPVYTHARPKYRVGSQYAVQPGRGKKAVGRIEITGIRKEDVREISDEDAKAEGFYNAFDFLRTWVAMYDKTREFYEREGTTGLWCFYDGKPRGWITETRDGLMDMLHSRPAERYQAWVLEFRLVETS